MLVGFAGEGVTAMILGGLSKPSFLAVLGAALLGRALDADEIPVEELLRRVEARTYYPQDHGLRDAEVEVELRAMGAKEGEARGKARAYWRLPGEMRLSILEYDGAEKWEYPRQVLERAADFIAIFHISEVASWGQATVGKDGELHRLHVEHPPDSQAGREVLRRTIWYDSTYREKRAELVAPSGMTTYISDPRVMEVDGKVLDTASAQLYRWPNGAERRSRVSFEREQVDGIWFVRRYTLVMDGWEIELRYKDYRVNQGLPDSVFSQVPEDGPEDSE